MESIAATYNNPTENAGRFLPAAQRSVIGKRYKTVKVLKEQDRGNVYNGVYIKGIFKVKPCIIKEGVPGVWKDTEGRDMVDRLKWQWKIQQDLKGIVPVPLVIDFFEESGRFFLVMEQAEGLPLSKVIGDLYRGRGWWRLANSDKLTLLDHLLAILNAVAQLHEHGYIHRDITPGNFLINRYGKLTLIDLELMYHPSLSPASPFYGGTAGFISPEQSKGRIPQAEEDIFGLGGLMICFFTNLSPLKFQRKDSDTLARNLHYFIGDRDITDLIVSCYHSDPLERPTLNVIIKSITDFRSQLETIGQKVEEPTLNQIDSGLATEMALEAVKGLAIPEEQLQSFLFEERLYRGMQSSIGGVILALAFAGEYGVDEMDMYAFKRFGRYFEMESLPDPGNLSSGLMDGSAGLALILAKAVEMGLLLDTGEYGGYIAHCMDKETDSLCLAKGAAGQGLALLLFDGNWDETEWYRNKRISIHNDILKKQSRDGSWPVRSDKGKGRVALGLTDGVAGILLYLMKYNQRYPDAATKETIRNGLVYLIRNTDGGQYKRNGWGLTKQKWDGTLFSGTAGIAYLFLEVYRQDQQAAYRRIASQLLSDLPALPVWTEYGLQYGLAGIGWVYASAAEILSDKCWRDRADHIVRLLQHTTKTQAAGGCFWNTSGKEGVEGLDLINGNAGITLFLLHYLKTTKKSHSMDKNIAQSTA